MSQVNPDILCLQETKVMDDSFPIEPFEKLGYSVEVYGQKSYNGVAIISKIKAENVQKGFYGCKDYDQNIEIFLDQKRLISADFNGIKIINVYVPNGSSLESEKFQYKINWLNCLASFLNEQEKEGKLICLMGDFNVAPSDLDIHDPNKYEGGIMASEIERNALNNVLKERLIDSFRIFEKNAGHWSWWDYRNNAYELNKGWRIDQIYISKELSSKLKSCVIDSSPRENVRPSDHVPVMIDLNLDVIDDDFFESEDDFLEI
jgi:exodeoxyribonuclease-3